MRYSKEIIFDKDRSFALYKEHYLFELNKYLKKSPFFFLVLIGGFLTLFGFVKTITLFFNLGLILLFFMLVYFLYCFFRYTNAMNTLRKELEENDIESERRILFSFDEEGVAVKSQNVNSLVKWELFSHFVENGDNCYVYLKNNKLHDIISQSILGDELYTEFLKIIKRKIKS